MTRLTFITLIILLTATLSACGDKGDAPDTPNNSIPDEIIYATQEEPSRKEWTEQEILSLFESKAKSNWTVIDCVRAPDFAFDCIGVVLFVDNDNGHTLLAFMDADGYYALCGTHGQLSVPAELEYCGNGIVTFKVKAKDGLVYECKITFSQSEDRRETNFIHEDNLEDILAEK